jgi:hypothetical protein
VNLKLDFKFGFVNLKLEIESIKRKRNKILLLGPLLYLSGQLSRGPHTCETGPTP